MSSTGRPLTPPDLLIRSTAICTPTSAVFPPAAATPDSGCSVPILYGFSAPKAARRELAAVPERLVPIVTFVVVGHWCPSLVRSNAAAILAASATAKTSILPPSRRKHSPRRRFSRPFQLSF